MKIYTLGHSRHPIGRLIQLLTNNQIEVLLDVRSTPYSRFNPQFNKNALQKSLAEQHIEYVYAGEELGGRPKDLSCYKQHAIPARPGDYLQELDYAEVMKRPWFQKGIDQLLETASLKTTAILCSEADPAKCHRHHLIACYLMKAHPQVTIVHILGDGSQVDSKSISCAADHPEAEQLSF
jgi:uncharacterized protein (DUF488 family)